MIILLDFIFHINFKLIFIKNNLLYFESFLIISILIFKSSTSYFKIRLLAKKIYILF
jgi:hypothetical protein